ncbi:3-hexulose-6-phosphate synthase [Falsibacillus pallidus]|uniref:3-hexulose-6-phosphate synthase n=1 Tax=Falsibacillus pallidus TaxID=493781 RepID=A0A370GCM7_9BACI|nr:3-hexulose-6-phosphate synthase [Falsibacillus pallidus]RDI40936.1 3-hexulose-6-phosphate synthase [Falsibacillus pallidus]
MKIQLALDRLEIADAIQITRMVEDSIDWIEVGTSLIKEFGMASVRELKQAFPAKTIVADMKTIDNARYEFEMAFRSGADVATVMGVSPLVTIDICMEVAARFNKKVMFDLLNTSEDQVRELMNYRDAIFCAHVSKDEQEESGERNKGTKNGALFTENEVQVAAAGGITIESLAALRKSLNPSVVIVGSAITKASNPTQAAARLKQAVLKGE